MLNVQKSHSGGPRYGLFVSLDRGMSLLIERLQTTLPSESILPRSRVRSVIPLSPSRGGSYVWITERPVMRMQFVWPCLLSRPLDWCEGIDPSTGRASRQHRLCVDGHRQPGLSEGRHPHPLDGFGFVVPAIEERPLLACTFSHIKFEGRAPEGYALLRAFVGGALQPKAFDMDDTEMIRTIRQNLRDLLEIQGAPVLVRVERHPQAMAQYRVGHLQLVQSH